MLAQYEHMLTVRMFNIAYFGYAHTQNVHDKKSMRKV